MGNWAWLGRSGWYQDVDIGKLSFVCKEPSTQALCDLKHNGVAYYWYRVVMQSWY